MLMTSWPNQSSLENTKLLWLIRLRWVVIGLSLAVGLLVRDALMITLSLAPIFSILAVMAVFNGLSLVRLKRGGPLRRWEVPLQLLFDLLVFTGLLYLGGGVDNPFMPMFLLPVAMATILIPGQFAWWFALLAAVFFGFVVLADYGPLSRDVGGTVVDPQTVGMWACLVLSAAVISYFVIGASQALRRTEKLLAETREQGLRNEHLAELGTLATGTAHELGTPLSTMAVVLGDLVKQHTSDSDLHDDLVLLKDQVYRCKDILSQLTRTTGVMRAEGGMAVPADVYLKNLLDEWQRRRPGVSLTYSWQSGTAAPRILAEQTLSQALLNIIDNAADASPEHVDVAAGCSDSMLKLDVFDRGPGVPEHVREYLGKRVVTGKPGGVGVGFLLADATVRRLGGQINLGPRSGGGTHCKIALPLKKIVAEKEAI